jgi:hypothetical protein
MHHVLRVNYNNLCVLVSKHLDQEGNYGHSASKFDERSHFAGKWACFGADSSMHYIWRVTGSEMSV